MSVLTTVRPAVLGGGASRRRAFTLVEIMVVVTIISILAATAVPTIKHVRRRSLASAIANDLRVFAAAFDAYAHEKGKWPDESDPGVIPTEMETRLGSGAWGRITPIGGLYNWENAQMHAGARLRAAIAISSSGTNGVVQDVDLFEAIDRVMDDGNLNTGAFRIGSDDEPVFIVSP